MSNVGVSQRPYLIPAYYSWMIASGFNPCIVVKEGYPGLNLPDGIADDGKIVLSLSQDSARDLEISSNWIVFEAVFDVYPVTVRVPMGSIICMFASETSIFVDFLDDPDLNADVVSCNSSSHKFLRFVSKNDENNSAADK